MVTIVKGNEKIICTRGTYEEQYKHLGYRLASKDEKEATNKVASSFEKSEKEANDDEAENDELTSKYGLKSSKKSTTSKKEEK
jgi:hypothetical protein